MDKVVIEEYYHMTTMDENVNWIELAHFLSKNILNPKGPLLYITLNFNILNRLFESTH